MAQHMDMNRESDSGSVTSSLYHPGNAHPPEGLATFVDKDIRADPS
jgi:hypothetical protein